MDSFDEFNYTRFYHTWIPSLIGLKAINATARQIYPFEKLCQEQVKDVRLSALTYEIALRIWAVPTLCTGVVVLTGALAGIATITLLGNVGQLIKHPSGNFRKVVKLTLLQIEMCICTFALAALGLIYLSYKFIVNPKSAYRTINMLKHIPKISILLFPAKIETANSTKPSNL